MLAPSFDNLELDNDAKLVESLEQRFTKQSKQKIKRNGIVSDLFDKEILSSLEIIFNNGRIGHQTLTILEFKQAIIQYIPENLVENICRSIDVNDTGFVNYSDFVNYLITSEQGTSFSNRTNASKFFLQCQQDQDTSVIHRDFIDSICYTKKPYPMVITGGRDGQVSIWQLDDLRLISNLNHRNKNRVYEEELYKNMDSLLKAQCTKYSSTYQNGRESKVAITSMLVLHNTGMICVGSADSCVTVYDLSNHEVCVRIKYLEFIPTAMTYFYRFPLSKYTMNHINLNPQVLMTPTNINNNNNTVTTTTYKGGNDVVGGTGTGGEDEESELLHLAIGDSSGNVHIIELHAEFLGSIDAGMKKKAYSLFAQSVQENLSICSAGVDWITGLKYVSEVDSLLVSAVDGVIHFLDLHKLNVVKSFNGHRGSHSGVRAFSWSPFGKYVASSSDRVLLFWDIFTLEVVGMIDNLKSPLISIEINDAEFKIIAILVNKSIMVWHSITYEFQQQISDPTSYKPSDNLASMCYIPEQHILLTAGNKITSWKLERSLEGPVEAEVTEDLCTALYNSLFNQIILVKSFGTVKIYQCETGAIIRQFNVLPLEYNTSQPIPLNIDIETGLYLPVVKHACLDKLQSRLIITSYDLSVQFWSVTDGTNLIQMEPQLYPYSMSKLYSHLPRVVSVVTFDMLLTNEKQNNTHTVNASSNSSSTNKHSTMKSKYVLFGTQNGNICGYQEINSTIDGSPSFFLRFHEINLADIDNIPAVTTTSGLPVPSTMSIEQTNQRKATQPIVPKSLRRSSVNPNATKRNSVVVGMGTSVTETRNYRLGSQMYHNAGGEKTVRRPTEVDNLLMVSPDTHSGGGMSNMLMEQARDFVKVDNPLLWMQSVEDTSFLLAGYSNGAVVVWNVETFSRMKDLDVSQYGPILIGMRMKGEKNMNRARGAYDAASSSSSSSAPVSGKVDGDTHNINNNSHSTQMSGGGGTTIDNNKDNIATNKLQQVEAAQTNESQQETTAISNSGSGNKPNLAVTDASDNKQERQLNQGDNDTGGSDVEDKKKNRKSKLESGNKNRTTRKNNVRLASSSALLARQNRRKSTAILQRLLNASSNSMAKAPKGDEEIASDLEEGDDSDTGSESLSVISSRNASFAAVQSREHSISVANTSQNNNTNNETNDVNALQIEKLAIADHHLTIGSIAANTTEEEDIVPFATTTTALSPSSMNKNIKLSRNDSASIVTQELALKRYSSFSKHRRITVSIDPLQQLRKKTNTSIEGQYSNRRSSAQGIDNLDTARLDQDSEDITPSSLSENCKNNQNVNTDKKLLSSAYNTTSSSVGVDSLLILPNTFVIIGACSDRYLRFWDLNTAHILCSCLYYVPAPQQQEPVSTGMHNSTPGAVTTTESEASRSNPNEILRILRCSDSEDALIGAYDTGMIRVWAIQSYSLVTLKGLLARHMNIGSKSAASNAGGGKPVDHTSPLGNILNSTMTSASFGTGTMAISPIVLMHQWNAHSSPIISIEYIWFNNIIPADEIDEEDFEEEDEETLTTSPTKDNLTQQPQPSPLKNKDLNTSKTPIAVATATRSSMITSNVGVGVSSPTKNQSNSKVINASNNYGVKIKREKQSDMGGQFLLDGYILSAGTDQRVLLWSITGKCVGLFGSYGWDINNEKTWHREIEKGVSNNNAKKKKKNIQELSSSSSSVRTKKMSQEDLTSATNITATSTNVLVKTPSTRIIENIMKQSHHTSADLNTYVQTFTRKVANKQSHTYELNRNFHHIMSKHPIIDISKAPERIKPIKYID